MIGWLAADWPAPAGILAGTTTRAGGVSAGAKASLNLGDHVGDDPEHVAENRRRLEQHLGFRQPLLWLNQVHSTDLVDARAPVAEPPTADAAISSSDHRPLVIMTADCLPLLFCTQDGRQIAAAHAGWRGLAAGVIERTLEALAVPPESVLVWLGPAISQAAYEVGDEVRDAFVQLAPAFVACFEQNTRGRWQADLSAIARKKLSLAGVSGVYGGECCTLTDRERFFSHRRNPQTGRQASVIGFASK